MENNTQNIENLVEYISQVVSLNRRIEKKKIDTNTIKLAFTQLDSKRKGYLDLADVFELAGNVTEDQLFIVFKWLDQSKTGNVSYEDFQSAFFSNQVSQGKEKSYPVERVKQIVTTYLQNFNYSQNLKNKLSITGQNLMNIYRSICQSQSKASLTTQDLIYVLSHSKKCDNLCQQQIKKMFRQTKFISENVFLQKFSLIRQLQPNRIRQQRQGNLGENGPVQYNEEKLVYQINSEYIASRNNQSPDIRKNEQAVNTIKQKYSKKPYIRQNKYTSEIKGYEIKVSDVKSSDSKLGQIDSMLSNIERRREQLRRGSLERKKLIQETLSRKKNHYTPNIDNQAPQIRSYSRGNSTSKPNSYSQSYLNNNYLEVNKSDLGKIFNKYREQKDTPSNFEQKIGRNSNYSRQIKYEKSYGSGSEGVWNQGGINKLIEKAYSTQQKPSVRNTPTLNISQWKYSAYNDAENMELNTPKFSQTAQQKFYQRPMSSNKADRIQQIKQKIGNLPQRNMYNVHKDAQQIDSIIQKYRNTKVGSDYGVHNTGSLSPKAYQYSQFKQQPQKSVISSYLRSNDSSFVTQNISHFSKTMNLRNFQNQIDQSYQRRPTPDSYLNSPKSRMNGSICQYRPVSGGIQKQNLLKRAEQQATRKIQQIERRAKMKVLQRKSAAGLKWLK